MDTLAIVELISAVYVGMSLIGQFVESEQTKSMRRIRMCTIIVLIWILSDALSTIFNGPQYNYTLIYIAGYLSYLLTGIALMAFLSYCDTFIKEKTTLNPWIFRTPEILMIANLAVVSVYYFSGKLMSFDNGLFVVTGQLPMGVLFYYLICVVYAPTVTLILMHKKRISRKSAILVSAFCVPLILAVIILQIAGIDYSVVLGAVSIIFTASMMQKNLTKEWIEKDASHRALLENNIRVLALEDNFEALFDVDLETGTYGMFVKGEKFGNIAVGLENTGSFFRDIINGFSQVVYYEDQDLLREILSAEYITKRLETKSHLDYYFRLVVNNSPLWVRNRILYKNSDKRNIIIGVFNAEEEVEQKQKEEKFRNELLEQMLKGKGVYLIDCVNDTRKAIYNPISEEEFNDIESYSTLITRYINKYVIEEDREKMLDCALPGNILKKLENREEYTISFIDIFTGIQRFNEMRIVKYSDNEILQSFRENDKEVVDDLMFRKLEEEYFALLCIDLDTGNMRVLKNTPGDFFGTEGEIRKYVPCISELKEYVVGEARDFMERLSNIDYIKERFREESRSSFVYTSCINGETKWVNVTGRVLTRHKNGIPSLFAIGFSYPDETAREDAKLRTRLYEDMQLIGGLASEYHTLCYINIDENILKIYTIDEQLFPEHEQYIRSGVNLFEMLHQFGTSELVHPDDRILFEKLDEASLREKLAHTKKLSIRFRRFYNDAYSWHEMDVIKYEDIDERANGIALGFAVRDAEIRHEQAITASVEILGNVSSPDEAIDEMLSVICEYYHGSRAYVYECRKQKEVMNNTYVWNSNADGLRNKELENILLQDIACGLKKFRNNGYFYIDSQVQEGLSAEELSILGKFEAESMVAVPIMNGDEITGFIGVNNPIGALNDINAAKTIAIFIQSEILKRKEEDEEHVTLEKLSDTFVSVYYVDLASDYMHNWKIDKEYREAYEGVRFYSESMGEYVRNRIAEDDRERCIEMTSPEYILEQFKTKDRFSIEMTDIMLGYEREFVFDYVKVNEEGTRIVVCCRDITETLARERNQQKLLQDALDAADVANRSKTRFLFNMSHDIRTPMNAISGFTDMAIKYIDDPDKALDCLHKTQQAGNMLLSLINSVLEVSRIESGNAVLEEQSADIYSSFTGIEDTMRELARAKSVDLTFEIGNIRNRYVYCDFSRCTRVFVNVISNAIKYTNEGGYVKVRCEQTEDENEGYGRYCYTVEDNGIGMSEEFQKHVFEQFSREKTATVSGIQGTGLGMSVCKSFVELMGGSITCKSRQGVGTVFTIILPFKLQEQKPDTDPVTGSIIKRQEDITEKQKTDFRGRKVLLVEDNELNREIVREFLRAEGFLLDEADDGTKAINILKDKGPNYYDCILMDIQMPIMNGYEATEIIRKMYPQDNIPIIALSANAFAEDKVASLAAGMNDHIAKPINVDELFNCLAKYIK